MVPEIFPAVFRNRLVDQAAVSSNQSPHHANFSCEDEATIAREIDLEDEEENLRADCRPPVIKRHKVDQALARLPFGRTAVTIESARLWLEDALNQALQARGAHLVSFIRATADATRHSRRLFRTIGSHVLPTKDV
ncbi:MAG TPA: hypothetical protein VID27_22290 [Blastocatellia bacterium]